ncbi:MAG: DUF2726 domain-containing protein [bacterium]
MIIVFALIVSKLSKKKSNPRYQPSGYFKSRYYLLSKTELKFYKILRLSIGNEPILIVPKVRVADIIKPVSEIKYDWNYKFNQIKSKHLDFLLCDVNNLKIIAGIELDDSSHLETEQSQRDLIKDNIFEEAKINLIRIRTESYYNVDDLKDELFQNEIISSPK